MSHLLGSVDPPFVAGQRVTIEDLPDDVLIVIFKRIHRMSLSYDYINARLYFPEPDPDCLHYQLNPDLIRREPWWPHVESAGWLDAANLFPGALISACSHWKDVLRQVSVFWTRLIIFVDDDPTPLSILQSHLSLSRTHPLEINILRHSCHYDDPDPLERSRVTAIMALLRPHLPRCKVLRMELRHHTSLPHPHIDFHGVADQLEVLQLEANDELERVENGYGPDQMLGSFNAAKLEILTIRSNIFHDVFVVPKQQLALLTDLTIYGGGETRDLSVRMVVCFVNELPNLETLSLTSLDLLCTEEPNLPPPPVDALESVYFEAINANVLSQFFRLRHNIIGFDARFSSCDTAPLNTSSISGLTIVHMAAEQDILDYLRAWDSPECGRLVIYGCPSLTANILDSFCHPLDDHDGEWLCPYMSDLDIDCTHLSSRDVRRVVEARYEAHAVTGFVASDDARFVVMSLKSLCVRHGADKLCEDDEEWFKKHVEHFNWTSEEF